MRTGMLAMVFGVLTALAFGCGGADLGDATAALAADQGDGSKSQAECEAKAKVFICHIPPGNPANAHNICISARAVDAHQAHHGDPIGPCDSSGGDSGGDSGGGGVMPTDPDGCAAIACGTERPCCAGWMCISGQCVLPPS